MIGGDEIRVEEFSLRTHHLRGKCFLFNWRENWREKWGGSKFDVKLSIYSPPLFTNVVASFLFPF